MNNYVIKFKAEKCNSLKWYYKFEQMGEIVSTTSKDRAGRYSNSKAKDICAWLNKKYDYKFKVEVYKY